MSLSESSLGWVQIFIYKKNKIGPCIIYADHWLQLHLCV